MSETSITIIKLHAPRYIKTISMNDNAELYLVVRMLEN